MMGELMLEQGEISVPCLSANTKFKDALGAQKAVCSEGRVFLIFLMPWGKWKGSRG